MRGEPLNLSFFSQMKGWVSGDRLAYLLILFTLAMGAITAYVLASVDFVSGDNDFLVPLLGVDVLALAVLAFLVGRQFWRLWVERRRRWPGINFIGDLHAVWWVNYPASDYCDLICLVCCRLFVAGLVCRSDFNSGQRVCDRG